MVRITAPEERCACFGTGTCAACQAAYAAAVESDEPLRLVLIEGGDVCAACADAVRYQSALVGIADDGICWRSARQKINDAVGHAYHCQAVAAGSQPCRWEQSHRWERIEGEPRPFRFRGMHHTYICAIAEPHQPHTDGAYPTVRYGVLDTFCLGREGDTPQGRLRIVVEERYAGSPQVPGSASGYWLIEQMAREAEHA